MKINTLLAVLIIAIMVLVSGCGKSSTVGQVVKETPEQPAEQPEQQAPEQAAGETEQPTEQPAEEANETETQPEPEVPEETKEPQKIAIVEIRGQRFIPQDLSVGVGTTVIWEHKDESIKNMKHSITIYSEAQGKPFAYGGSFNHTFNNVGEFKYIDSIYKDYMPMGTISVHE